MVDSVVGCQVGDSVFVVLGQVRIFVVCVCVAVGCEVRDCVFVVVVDSVRRCTGHRCTCMVMAHQ